MKTLGILLLTLIFLGQTFRQPVIFISYQVNKDVIIKTLCENRDKPELKCNGKCHLKKKLKESSEKEKSDKNSNSIEKVELFVTVSNALRSFPILLNNEYISGRQELVLQPATPLFRPPAV